MNYWGNFNRDGLKKAKALMNVESLTAEEKQWLDKYPVEYWEKQEQLLMEALHEDN